MVAARPYWKEMSVVEMASIPQVALETAQPMLLMVLINAIVEHDTARVWAGGMPTVSMCQAVTECSIMVVSSP